MVVVEGRSSGDEIMAFGNRSKNHTIVEPVNKIFIKKATFVHGKLTAKPKKHCRCQAEW
jgi:hypothetical protein